MEPLADRVLDHIRAGERVFADETTLPTLEPGAGKAKIAWLWTYARDYAHLVIMRSSPGQSANFLRQISEMVAGTKALRCT